MHWQGSSAPGNCRSLTTRGGGAQRTTRRRRAAAAAHQGILVVCLELPLRLLPGLFEEHEPARRKALRALVSTPPATDAGWGKRPPLRSGKITSQCPRGPESPCWAGGVLRRRGAAEKPLWGSQRFSRGVKALQGESEMWRVKRVCA